MEKFNIEIETSKEEKPKVKILISSDSIGAETTEFTAVMAEGLPVVEISLDKLIGLEPDEKMEIEEHGVKMESMAQAIRDGKILDPMLVRVYENGYQVLDGHHRLHAYKKA